MKLEIPIIVGFDNMESLLDDLKKLQTYKLFEGDDMVLVDIDDVAKVLMDHVKAKEYVKGDDLIRREDALSCFHDWIDSHGDVHTADEMPEFQRIEQLPSAQPERTCVNCGRTANNGGWYADGRTRCPIEEHYALPKDGYCHLWEKRNVTDDDYPERREE